MLGIVDRVLDWVLPPRCMACAELLSIDYALRMCALCYEELIPCTENHGQSYSAYIYDGVARTALHRFKYGPNPHFGSQLGLMMAWRIDSLGIMEDFGVEAVVPVPLHADKRRERGFNQAQLLAEEVAANIAVPMLPLALVRTKKTQPQANLRLSERQDNIRGAFLAGPQIREVHGKTILLMDDIHTTGTTLWGCADTLMAEGAACVLTYTFARAELE